MSPVELSREDVELFIASNKTHSAVCEYALRYLKLRDGPCHVYCMMDGNEEGTTILLSGAALDQECDK